MKPNRLIECALVFFIFTCWSLSSAIASSYFEFEGEAIVIKRSEIPNKKKYVNAVTDPKRDKYERVLKILKITKSEGHEIIMDKDNILFVQSVKDLDKRAVGYYPIVLTGGKKSLGTLEPGVKIIFSCVGSEGDVPEGYPIGSATLTVKNTKKQKPNKSIQATPEDLPNSSFNNEIPLVNATPGGGNPVWQLTLAEFVAHIRVNKLINTVVPTNEDPPKLIIEEVQMLRGKLPKSYVNAIWVPAGHGIDYGDENAIKAWAKKPCHVPDEKTEWIVCGYVVDSNLHCRVKYPYSKKKYEWAKKYIAENNKDKIKQE